MYHAVNWNDGMKINKAHFIDQENVELQRLLNTGSALLNDFNYGLLPGKDNPGTRLFLSVDNQQQVHLRIIQLTAITRGGYHIHIEANSDFSKDQLSADLPGLSVPFETLKGKSSAYFVILSVNPFERVAFGIPDLEEHPPRLPWVKPPFQVSLVPEELMHKNLGGHHHLPVGKLKIEDHHVHLDEEYIPPCTTIGTHPGLLVIHALIEQFYGKMELYALQIIQKILQKKQANELASIVRNLSETITMVTASHLAEIRMLSIHQPPVYLVNKLSSFARFIRNTLDFYIGSGKEEFVNYCTEWCNISQGELESAMTALANEHYDHLDLNKSLDTVRSFTRTISHLFGSLARLEYIGKRKEAGIFVKENVVNSDPPEIKKRKSFLAD